MYNLNIAVNNLNPAWCQKSFRIVYMGIIVRFCSLLCLLRCWFCSILLFSFLSLFCSILMAILTCLFFPYLGWKQEDKESGLYLLGTFLATIFVSSHHLTKTCQFSLIIAIMRMLWLVFFGRLRTKQYKCHSVCFDFARTGENINQSILIIAIWNSITYFSFTVEPEIMFLSNCFDI